MRVELNNGPHGKTVIANTEPQEIKVIVINNQVYLDTGIKLFGTAQFDYIGEWK